MSHLRKRGGAPSFALRLATAVHGWRRLVVPNTCPSQSASSSPLSSAAPFGWPDRCRVPAVNCRIEPFLYQGGAARGAAGPASAPGSALGGPPGARRATPAGRADQSGLPVTQSGTVRSHLPHTRLSCSRTSPKGVRCARVAARSAAPTWPRPVHSHGSARTRTTARTGRPMRSRQ